MKQNKPQAESHEAVFSTIRRIGIWGFVILLILVIAYGANNRLDISEYTYYTRELPLSFNGYRIVHLSDLHNKVFDGDNTPLLDAISALEPDLIVLTGDIIDASNHTNVEKAKLFMEQIVAIAPTYSVYGNHEHLLSKSVLSSFEETVKSYGVNMLYNERVQLTSETGQTISLIGMDDLSLQANILQNLVQESEDDFRILLAHEPQLLQSDYAPSSADIVFAGHAHGGQFRIPFLCPQGLYAPDQGILPKMTSGVFVEGDTTMYVSRGLGNSMFPLRAFNHPEIICVTLQYTE